MVEIPTLWEFQGTPFSLPTIGTKRGEYMCVCWFARIGNVCVMVVVPRF